MLENLQSVNVFSPSLSEITINILLSLVCSFCITIIYRITYRGNGYSNNFVNSIMFLSIITTVVIMIIGNNLARAFGLVGALSIIRFRTAIKETMDIVYIFFGLAIGMAAGVGYHTLAIAGTILIGMFLLVFSKTKLFTLKRYQYLLQFIYLLKETNEYKYLPVINKYCRWHKLINIKTIDDSNSTEYSFYVRLKK